MAQWPGAKQAQVEGPTAILAVDCAINTHRALSQDLCLLESQVNAIISDLDQQAKPEDPNKPSD